MVWESVTQSFTLTTKTPDGLFSASLRSPANIAVGGGEAKTDPAIAADMQPFPT